MNRTNQFSLAAAAMVGLLAGASARANAAVVAPVAHSAVASISAGVVSAPNVASHAGVKLADPVDKSKHDCKGKNECKGLGGCKTGDNGCKAKNSCKGHGGCKTNDTKKSDKL